MNDLALFAMLGVIVIMASAVVAILIGAWAAKQVTDDETQKEPR